MVATFCASIAPVADENGAASLAIALSIYAPCGQGVKVTRPHPYTVGEVA